MDINFEQKVRERAYEIWMAAGMADGVAHDNWVMAEQAVANESGEPVKAPKKKTTSKTKAAPEAKSAKSATNAKSVKAAPKAKIVGKATAPKVTAETSRATH